MIHIADDRRDGCVESWLQCLLLRAAHGAKQDLWIAQRSLQCLHRVVAFELDAGQLLGHGGRIGTERGNVATHQLAEILVNVLHRKHDVRGQLLHKYPEPHGVAWQAPIVGEGIDGSRHNGDPAADCARNGEVVLAERTRGEVTDH